MIPIFSILFNEDKYCSNRFYDKQIIRKLRKRLPRVYPFPRYDKLGFKGMYGINEGYVCEAGKTFGPPRRYGFTRFSIKPICYLSMSFARAERRVFER